MQAGLAPGLEFPLRLALCWPVPPLHSGHWVLPEGRGHASSIPSLYLEEPGKGQDKGMAVQVEGSAYTYGGQLRAALVCREFAPLLHCPPSPPCPVTREPSSPDCVNTAPCSQASRWVCPKGGANRRSQGRRKGRMVSVPLAASLRGCRMTALHPSTQRQPSLAAETHLPPAPPGQWYNGILCCWPSRSFARPCSFPSNPVLVLEVVPSKWRFLPSRPCRGCYPQTDDALT